MSPTNLRYEASVMYVSNKLEGGSILNERLNTFVLFEFDVTNVSTGLQ